MRFLFQKSCFCVLWEMKQDVKSILKILFNDYTLVLIGFKNFFFN